MSRKRAHRELNWEDGKQNSMQRSFGSTAMGPEEMSRPTVYKNIDKVMEEQK